MSVAIGTAILEDKKFVAEFIALNQKRLSEAYAYTTKTLDEAGIGYYKGGYALHGFPSPFFTCNDISGTD
jgi:1-aminocyclopropane-1-carboxylate synthase